VYAAELQLISARAKSLEADGHLLEARDEWNAALKLLPADSKQNLWIVGKLTELENAASASPQQGSAAVEARKPLLATISAFLVSFALFIVFESFYGGLKFGIGFSVLILIHEFGHFIDVKRRGMKADLPVFIPGLGAFVRFRSSMISREVRAGISLAGPLAGLLSSSACAGVWYATGDKYWASLAQSGAWLNLLNLTPVWVLDGGQAASALGKPQRAALLLVSIVMWKLSGESVYLIVAAGALFRSISKDAPQTPSIKMSAYFAALLVLLGLVMYLAPGTGFGIY
jgi:Zn-dependent protease